jgi:hypothetical protein
MPANSAKGLYANIHAKKARIKAGSGEKCVRLAQKERPVRAILLKQKRLQKWQRVA